MFSKKINELPKQLADFIHLAGHIADEKKINVYVVGGFVRDLILGVDNFDVDLVVEGDGIGFATECSRKLNARLITHKRFGTATLLGIHNFKVDVATARKEIYEKPGVLPTVFHGKIEDDLFRRDFTINAMAISINEGRFGQIIDLYSGQRDLKTGLIRALHPLSFIDDPTRILRAMRFEQRFDFRIEKTTLSWIKNALRQKMLHQVQKHRLRDELILIFKEASPVKSLKRLYEICGFSYIALHLSYKREWRLFFEEINKKILWFKEHFLAKRHLDPYVMFMSLFFYQLPLKELQKVIREFAFHKGESSRMVSLKENYKKVNKELSKRGIRPSTVYRLLEPLPYETILLIKVLSRHQLVHQRIEDFLFIFHGQRLHVRGEDLVQLGIKPGPHYKKILEALLYAKIDGKVKTKEEELEFAERLASLR